jgi:hypothetical protein
MVSRNTPAILVSYLARLNKLVKGKRLKKEYNIAGVNISRAWDLYDTINYDQKRLINAISADIDNSKEFNLHSVLIYSVLYYRNTNSIWMFSDEDYIRIKQNFKQIYTTFNKKSYINTIKTIIDNITNKEISINDLVKIRADGNSIIYKQLLSDNFSWAVCSKLDYLFDSSNLKKEAPEHKEFRKFLKLINAIQLIN